MSDQAEVVGEVADDPKSATEVPALAGGKVPVAPAGDVVEDTKPDWPDDWRDKFTAKAKAEDREKLSKRLARFASPDNVLSSYLELERKVGAGALKPVLPEGASDEEVANFRKAWGVPDAPEQYGVQFPEGLDVTDSDKADLSEFLTTAHKLNLPAAQAKGVADWYFGLRAKAEQQLYDAAHDATINQRAAIRAEYGKDFDRNIRLAKGDLTTTLGSPDAAEELVSVMLSNGTKLGDHPAFINYVVRQALKGADETALITSDLDASGTSLEDAYSAALNLKFSDPTKYHSDEHQKKLLKLSAARVAKPQRAA